MAKYGYDKSVLKGLGVGDFLNQVKVRQSHIEEGDTEIPTSTYYANRLAAQLHPGHLLGKVRSVTDLGAAMHYVIEPLREAGFSRFPFFKAGQNISIEFDMGDRYACRPYTLINSPKTALNPDDSYYEILVAQIGPGHMSQYIKDNWEVGTELSFGSPVGTFVHEPLRDGKNVIALCGGVMPYISMAQAIADGVDDYNLTIILLSPLFNTFPERLNDAVNRSNGKVKVVTTLLPNLPGPQFDPEKFEAFSADLVSKYLNEDTTLYFNGPDFLQKLIVPEIAKLGLPQRKIRNVLGPVFNVAMDPGFPNEAAGKTFNIKVWARGEYREISCRSEQSILDAIHDAGIHLTSDCRSGYCGWCHSRLISGRYYMPASRDGRREADRKFGWIHPCCTFPLSNIEMEIFPLMALDW